MDIQLITEGTYPYYMGGVSVWCDQLVRALTEHQFRVFAISATGTEHDIWGAPANVPTVDSVPLWGRTSPRRASRALQRRSEPVLRRFLRSLAFDAAEADFEQSLRELYELAQAGQLSSAMSSASAVELLLSEAPASSDRPGAYGFNHLSVADAVDVMISLEHFLRPLAARPVHVDLCHSVANGLGALPALIAKWTWGTPFLMTEHGLYMRERYLSYKPGNLNQPARAIVLRFFRLLVEVAYAHADIVAPGSGYNQGWELANRTPPGRIRPVHNGVDPEEFPAAPDEPSAPVLAWVGRIDPLKDVETLLRAFALILAQVPQCQLRVFGPTSEENEQYRQRCAKLAAALRLDQAVTFEGRVSSVQEAYRAGQVVVHTSISEGLPYTVLEAMATGRPVVATDVGGVAEAIGDAGMLVPPRNPQAVADACVRLLASPGQRRALGAAARDRIVQHFTAEQCFDQYRQIYRELSTGHPGPPPAQHGPVALFQMSQGYVSTAVPV